MAAESGKVNPFATGPMGLPGQVQHLIAVNHFKDPKDPRNEGGPAGLPGAYEVIFVLSRPGFPLTDENVYLLSTDLRGDSHLAITKPAYTPPGNPNADQLLIKGITPDGEFNFVCYSNEKGFLGRIECKQFQAESFVDAQIKAYRALLPSLSNWSIHLDIPLNVHQMSVRETRTGNLRTRIRTSFLEVPCAINPAANLSPDFMGPASLYREALNSDNPSYSFLCFFKIMEAVRIRRNRLGQQATAAGTPLTKPVEQVPSNKGEFIPWLNAIFHIRPVWDEMAFDSVFRPGTIGRKFGFIHEYILNPLRLKIAHGLSSASGELTHSADELLHTQEVNQWLPLTKCMVRRMLKNDFPNEFLSYLKEDGTIVA